MIAENIHEFVAAGTETIVIEERYPEAILEDSSKLLRPNGLAKPTNMNSFEEVHGIRKRLLCHKNKSRWDNENYVDFLGFGKIVNYLFKDYPDYAEGQDLISRFDGSENLKMQIAFKLNPLNARKHPAWFEALKVTTFFYRVNDYLDAYKDIAKASSQTDEDLLDAIGKIPIQDWDDGMDQKVVLDLQKRNYNFNGPKDFIRSNRNYTLHSAVSETAFQF